MDGDNKTGSVEQWLVEECALRLAQALEAMTGQACQAKALAGAASEPAGSAWWRQPLSVAAGADLWAGAAEAAWSAIGGQALQAAGIEDAEDSDRESTYHEILTQAFSATAQTIGARLGREVTCQPGAVSAEGPGAQTRFPVEIEFPGNPPVQVVLAFGAALVNELEGPGRGAGEIARPAAAAAPAGSADGGPAKTLDLLLEVELPVSVSFGRAQLPLKDVLKLTSGSIVELNRPIAEPVELIVNNCVIARGEVVVVEGNYGIRIGQIVSRQERLRSLY